MERLCRIRVALFSVVYFSRGNPVLGNKVMFESSLEEPKFEPSGGPGSCF